MYNSISCTVKEPPFFRMGKIKKGCEGLHQEGLSYGS